MELNLSVTTRPENEEINRFRGKLSPIPKFKNVLR